MTFGTFGGIVSLASLFDDIIAWVDGKVAAGASKSSAAKIRSAVNGLLKAKGITAENAMAEGQRLISEMIET